MAVQEYQKINISDGNETTIVQVDKWGKLSKDETIGRGTTYFCRASIAGTLKIVFIDKDGTADAGNVLKSETLAADTLTVIDFDLPVPRYKVTFTRSGSSAGTCAVEVFDY